MPTYYHFNEKQKLYRFNEEIRFAKWCGLLVAGDRLDENQTAEIIIKTNAWYRFYFNQEDNETSDLIKRIYFNHLPVEDQIDGRDQPLEISKFYKIFDLKDMSFNHLHNNLISINQGLINGLWIDWDGNVDAHGNNVGKKCSLIGLLYDVKKIKEKFNYIKNLSFQFLRYENSTPIDNPVILTIKIVDEDVIFSVDDLEKISKSEKPKEKVFPIDIYLNKIRQAFDLAYKIRMR